MARSTTHGLSWRIFSVREGMLWKRLPTDSHFWILCLLFLHVIIAMHALQWYAADVLGGNQPHLIGYLFWYIQVWYSRALLAPFAAWVAFRFPFRPNAMFRTIGVYMVGGVVLGVFGSGLQSIILVTEYKHGFSMQPLVRSSSTPVAHPPMTDFQKMMMQGYHLFLYNVFICWVVMGMVQAINTYRLAQKKRLEASELEAQLVRARLDFLRLQLNPHFLFNTLHAISTLIHTDVNAAESMLLSVSDLLRMLLKEEQGSEVLLQNELDLLRRQLEIEQMRFGDRLSSHIYASADLLDYAVPQMLLQPIVENAIRHGIGRKNGADCIEIFIHRNESQLLLEVRNSCSSLDRSVSEASHHGIGLRNTRERLETLYHDQYSLKLQNLDPVGVSVKIAIPLRRLIMNRKTLQYEGAVG